MNSDMAYILVIFNILMYYTTGLLLNPWPSYSTILRNKMPQAPKFL